MGDKHNIHTIHTVIQVGFRKIYWMGVLEAAHLHDGYWCRHVSWTFREYSPDKVNRGLSEEEVLRRITNMIMNHG